MDRHTHRNKSIEYIFFYIGLKYLWKFYSIIRERKYFLIEEFQLINRKGITALKYRHFVTQENILIQAIFIDG